MARTHDTRRLARTEEAVIVLFCLADDTYAFLNPRGRRHESLKKLSDSEVFTLALLQQLRGFESCRSFLRDAERFFAHLFPGVLDLAPSSFHRRLRNLRRFLEPLRHAILDELVGDPETLIADSTLLSVMHPRQVRQSAAGFEGTAWSRWGSFAVYGVKLHLLCSTNRVPLSYELTAAIGLWNAVYLERVVAALRARGEEVPDEYLRHLSPLEWEHVTLTGVYRWDLRRRGGPEAEYAADGFRPLRKLG